MQYPSEKAKILLENCRKLLAQQRLTRQKRELEAKLPEAKYQKREAEVALTEYECGGFGVWLDKLRGSWEEKHENLRRNASAAQSKLQELQMQAQRLDAELSQLEGTDSWDSIRQAADTLSPQEREAIFGKLAQICAQSLLENLQEAATALQEAQQWARPNNRIDTAPGYTLGQLLAKAEECARQCGVHLQELEQCGISLERHSYFQNPTGYIHAVATPYGKLDRINGALEAISRTEKQIQELLMQLSDTDVL